MISHTTTGRRLLCNWFAVIVAVFVGCDLNVYIPSAEKLRNPQNPSSAFIHNEQSIRGVYGNHDVDSAIYTYQTMTDNADEFWTAIEQAADADDWTIIEDSEQPVATRRFLRIIPKTGQKVFHSVEEVRIFFNSNNNRVVVAWVQSDQRTLPEKFPADGPEGGFAESVVWPRFESEVSNPAEGQRR